MNKLILLIAFVFSLGVISCQKTAPRKACFTFSKSKVSLGDTVYIFNCSETYNKFIWTVETPIIDSVNRNIKVVANSTGYFVVKLNVGGYDMHVVNQDTVGTSKIDSFLVQ